MAPQTALGRTQACAPSAPSSATSRRSSAWRPAATASAIPACRSTSWHAHHPCQQQPVACWRLWPLYQRVDSSGWEHVHTARSMPGGAQYAQGIHAMHACRILSAPLPLLRWASRRTARHLWRCAWTAEQGQGHDDPYSQPLLLQGKTRAGVWPVRCAVCAEPLKPKECLALADSPETMLQMKKARPTCHHASPRHNVMQLYATSA